MKMINVTKWAVVIKCTGFMAFTVQPAKADSITFNLTTGNSAISGYPGPYASVLVDRTSTTTATITFTSLTATVGTNHYIYLFGGESSVDVNVNATSFTLSNIMGSNAGTGFTPGGWTDNGSGNVDGFGTFNQRIKSFDGYGHSSDNVSFDLTDTSGTWANAMAVLLANSSGSLAGAHIFVASYPANASNGALATGYAGNGITTDVPDGGSTVLLLGAELSAIGLVHRKLSEVRFSRVNS